MKEKDSNGKAKEGTVYELVDCEGLATALAEDAWEEEMKNRGISKDDLYEVIVIDYPDEPELRRHVKPQLAYDFFALRECYLSLIYEHKIPDPCTSQEKQMT
jgi:hypothetical protein